MLCRRPHDVIQQPHKVTKLEPPEEPCRLISPAQLEFTDWEQEDIPRLWPLFSTPRTVKRFVNTYRLMRAGLESAEETEQFEGKKEKPGEYQVALLLLAVVTSATREAMTFLSRLDEPFDEPGASDKPLQWEDVFATIKEPIVDEAWEEFIDNLEHVTQEGFERGVTRSELERWTNRVARYSFSVRP